MTNNTNNNSNLNLVDVVTACPRCAEQWNEYCHQCGQQAPGKVVLRVVNLTPHAIVVREGARTNTIPPSGQVARVGQTPGRHLGGILYSSPTTSEVEGLPDPRPGVWYLVSGMVSSALAGKGRRDVFSPGTGPADGAIRDADGRIVAVTRLIQAPQ